MPHKQKIIVICGATASGKSNLAVWLARKIGGEIISADSRQVYKGLNIGSGKIAKKEMFGIRHHLLDVANPKNRFSVSDYKKLADPAIGNIITRGKVPIICGGTGFYIDTVVNNLILPEVPPDEGFRLEGLGFSNAKLFEILKKLDPKRAKTIDKNNKIRLIRAIEIAKALGKVPAMQTTSPYDTLWIGISWSNEALKQKIKKRLNQRINVGMINEVRHLHKKGLSWKRMDELGLEYRYLSQFLQNKLTKAQMIEKLNIEIWHYAKRQMTWFKRNKKIQWFRPTTRQAILNRTTKFLNQK